MHSQSNKIAHSYKVTPLKSIIEINQLEKYTDKTEDGRAYKKQSNKSQVSIACDWAVTWYSRYH